MSEKFKAEIHVNRLSYTSCGHALCCIPSHLSSLGPQPHLLPDRDGMPGGRANITCSVDVREGRVHVVIHLQATVFSYIKIVLYLV